MKIPTEAALTLWLNELLADTELGSLSDTPYQDSSLNSELQLELWESTYDPYPSASIDTPQLARGLIKKMQGL